MRKKNTNGEGRGEAGWRVRDRGKRGCVMPDNYSESTKRKEQVTKRLQQICGIETTMLNNLVVTIAPTKVGNVL